MAPVGATIIAARLERDLYKRNDNTWVLFVSDQSGAEVPGQDCSIGPGEYQCEVGGTLDLTGLHDQSLAIGVRCNTTCGNGTSAHNVRADLDHAVVTLSDPTPPAAPTATGPLSQPSWQSGKVVLGVSSSDAVGIRRVEVRAPDGTVLAGVDQACDYTYPVPCPQAGAVPLPIDTTHLADGIDQLTLVATDTAQNTATATLSVMVANIPPPAPVLSGAQPGPTAERPARITARFPTGPVPIAKLVWMLCSSTCGSETSVPVGAGVTSATFEPTAPGAGAYTVRAYSVDVAGHASAATTEAYDVASPAAPVTLPDGPHAGIRLPETVGRGGVHLRLSVRRLPRHRLEIAVRTSPKRSGILLLRLAFAGHRPQSHRLHLRNAATGVVARIPDGANDLTVSLAGFGASSRRHVHLAAASRRRA